jgi:hypothetical protein
VSVGRMIVLEVDGLDERVEVGIVLTRAWGKPCDLKYARDVKGTHEIACWRAKILPPPSRLTLTRTQTDIESRRSLAIACALALFRSIQNVHKNCCGTVMRNPLVKMLLGSVLPYFSRTGVSLKNSIKALRQSLSLGEGL